MSGIANTKQKNFAMRIRYIKLDMQSTLEHMVILHGNLVF